MTETMKSHDTMRSWRGGRPATARLTLLALVAAVAPSAAGASVLGFALASDPRFDDRYRAGDEIVVAATFGQPVRTIGEYRPTLKFALGGVPREARYAGGSGTATLTFGYVLAKDDEGPLAIPADALADSVGTVEDLGGLMATLDAQAATLPLEVGADHVPLLPLAGAPSGRQGFVRFINHSAEAGEVSLHAIDDAGWCFGPVTLSIGANASVHLNSADLEDGNPAKGLSGGVGTGKGAWRLEVASALEVEAIGYIRHADGFLTAMNSVAPMRDGKAYVATFNPGSNLQQSSRLRLFNAGYLPVDVRIAGTDDAGRSPGGRIRLSLDAGLAAGLGAGTLEAGSGVAGALGNGVGKWRLAVSAPPGVPAMSLMTSSSGHLTNLSTAPTHRRGDALVVPLFLSASDPNDRQGLARVVNRSDTAGTVTIRAFDDRAVAYDPVTLSIGAREVVHFNSDDLEMGNAAKGLTGSTGPGSAGQWRLHLTSDLDIEVLAYARHADGFLTSMHDVAPKRGGVHRVASFNPGSNTRQASRLRIVNLDAEEAQVAIGGIDGDGASPGAGVTVAVPAGRSMTFGAKALEEGSERFEGALGDGASKWRLQVTSEQDILVMSLMQSPTGHLTNLSARPMVAD